MFLKKWASVAVTGNQRQDLPHIHFITHRSYIFLLLRLLLQLFIVLSVFVLYCIGHVIIVFVAATKKKCKSTMCSELNGEGTVTDVVFSRGYSHTFPSLCLETYTLLALPKCAASQMVLHRKRDSANQDVV